MNIGHPTERILRSTNVHNSDIMVATDWVEAVSLFFTEDEEEISITDLVDTLTEDLIYDDQDFCTEFVDSIFSEIRTRSRMYSSNYPLTIRNRSLRRTQAWQDHSALSFCVLVSVLPFYSGYSSWVAGNYNEQGDLFEQISEAALRHWFPGWDVFRTGWAAGKGFSLSDLLTLIADRTIEVVRSEAMSVLTGSEKDLGMDIAAVRLFPDGRASLPVIFGQCASGRNWPDKLPTPDASRWKQLLTLTHTPLRAFSLPFRLGDSEYDSRRSQFKGLLLDRSRLLPGETPETEWLSEPVISEVIKFAETRIDWLNEQYGRQ